MHKIKSEFHFKTHSKEPIILSGKIFGIKLLSIYDFILMMKKYDNILRKILRKNLSIKLCKSIAEKASLVSMCLYTYKDKRVFDTPLDVLKNLTSLELNLVYREYVKLEKQTRNYENKSQNIFENVKKHSYQQILQKTKE